MFKALFTKETRYFFVAIAGHGPQLFASIASALNWLSRCGISDSDKARFQLGA